MAKRDGAKADAMAGGKKGRSKKAAPGAKAPERESAPGTEIVGAGVDTPGAATKRDRGRPSSLLDTRVVYCGDNLEQLAKLHVGFDGNARIVLGRIGAMRRVSFVVPI